MGGTDFDRLLNIDRVMPHLGLGSKIGYELGEGAHVAPRALFHDLARWEKIPFQYTAQTRREVAKMERLAQKPELWARLVEVLEMELAHQIAHAVESAKIATNGGGGGTIALDFVEKGLRPDMVEADLWRVLGGPAADIARAALEALRGTGVEPDQVTRVVMVGGSSLMRVIEAGIRTVLPKAKIDRSDAFTGVVDGLALGALSLPRQG